MGFDDLARHMASRDKRKLGTASADELVAEAQRSDHRMTRTRNLVLGTLLLAGGLAACVLVYFTLSEMFGVATQNHSAPAPFYPAALTFVALAMVIAGTTQLVRGLRSRSA
jgi:hypothetical protein